MKCNQSRSARIDHRVAFVLSALLAAPGCVVEDPTINSPIDDVGAAAVAGANATSGSASANLGRGAVPDGASNTILVGESDAAAGPEAGSGAATENGRGARPNQDTSAPNPSTGGASGPVATGDTGQSPPTADAAAQERAAEAQLESQFVNRGLEFGRSSFFSSGSITSNTELTLCPDNRFGMRVTRITSTSFSTSSAEDRLVGRWSIDVVGDAVALVLDVQDASDAGDVGVRRLVVTANDTTLFLDGNAVRNITDATGACQ